MSETNENWNKIWKKENSKKITYRQISLDIGDAWMNDNLFSTAIIDAFVNGAVILNVMSETNISWKKEDII